MPPKRKPAPLPEAGLAGKVVWIGNTVTDDKWFDVADLKSKGVIISQDPSDKIDFFVCMPEDFAPNTAYAADLEGQQILHPNFVIQALKTGKWPTDLHPFIIKQDESTAFADLEEPETRKVQIKGRPIETASSASTTEENSTTLKDMSSEVLEVISSYLHSEEGVSLLKLGPKSMQQKMAQLRVVRIVPPVASEFFWPTTTLSYFTHAKDVTIACPEYYDHLPFNNFSAIDIPKTIQHLTLGFRNAIEIFHTLPSLRSVFPDLESLKIESIDSSQVRFTSTTEDECDDDDEYIRIGKANIEGIKRLSVGKIHMAISEIDNLPESLIELSQIHIYEKGDEDEDFVPKWPEHLEKLEIRCDKRGGNVIRGLAKLKNLTSLSLHCNQHEPAVDTNSIKALPSTLKSLDLAVITPSGLDPDGHLSSNFLEHLPAGLEELELEVPTFEMDWVSKGPQQLTKLLIHAPEVISKFKLHELPRTITDLKLPKCGDYSFGIIEDDDLQALPPSLARLSCHFLSADQFSFLPKSLTDLSVKGVQVDDEDEVKGLDEEGFTLPLLRGLYLPEIIYSEGNGFAFPFAKFFPNLEFLYTGYHVEPDDFGGIEAYKYPENLKHLAEGVVVDGEDWVEMVKKLPPTLKSYSLTFPTSEDPNNREDFSMIQHLPQSLTALSLRLTDSVVPPEALSSLPPHLTYLAIPPDEESIPELTNLPKTLRLIETESDVTSDSIPTYCRICVPPKENPRLNGRWWLEPSSHEG